jgi:hypothetical protein
MKDGSFLSLVPASMSAATPPTPNIVLNRFEELKGRPSGPKPGAARLRSVLRAICRFVFAYETHHRALFEALRLEGQDAHTSSVGPPGHPG